MIRIVKAVQTCVAAPEQWELWDDQGGQYYARHRHGRGVVYPVAGPDQEPADGHFALRAPEEGVEWSSDHADLARILGEADMKLADDAEVIPHRLEEEPDPLQAHARFLADYHPLLVLFRLLVDPRGAEKVKAHQDRLSGILAKARERQDHTAAAIEIIKTTTGTPEGHRCRDCASGIMFDCHHLVRGRYLADNCDWCKQHGYLPNQPLPEDRD